MSQQQNDLESSNLIQKDISEIDQQDNNEIEEQDNVEIDQQESNEISQQENIDIDQQDNNEIGRQNYRPIARPPQNYRKLILDNSLSNMSVHDEFDSNVNVQVAIDDKNVGHIKEPESYFKLKNNPYENEWRKAMREEIDSLENNGTWKLITKDEVPSDRRLIKSKWVFKIKQGPDGELDRFKARLVAKGFTQVEGIDYDEIFSPVLRHGTIKLLLSLAAINDWDIKQMDVVTAFLNPKLEKLKYFYLNPNTPPLFFSFF